MSAKVRELIDKDSVPVYPVTRASAVYMPGGTDTVERVLGDMHDQNTLYEISGNTIKKTMASGNIETTVFNDDGTITVTTTDSEETVLEVKHITFGDDGTITIIIDGEDDDEE